MNGNVIDLNFKGLKKQNLFRLGFKYEGVFRQAVVYKKRNRDTAWFSMLLQRMGKI